MKRKPKPPSAGELHVMKLLLQEPTEQTLIWVEVLKVAAESTLGVEGMHPKLKTAVEEVYATQFTAKLALRFLYKLKDTATANRMFKRRRKTCLRAIRNNPDEPTPDNVVNIIPRLPDRFDDDDEPRPAA